MKRIIRFAAAVILLLATTAGKKWTPWSPSAPGGPTYTDVFTSITLGSYIDANAQPGEFGFGVTNTSGSTLAIHTLYRINAFDNRSKTVSIRDVSGTVLGSVTFTASGGPGTRNEATLSGDVSVANGVRVWITCLEADPGSAALYYYYQVDTSAVTTADWGSLTAEYGDTPPNNWTANKVVVPVGFTYH